MGRRSVILDRLACGFPTVGPLWIMPTRPPSYPPLPRYRDISHYQTLKMSPTMCDASVVYMRARSAYVLIWTLCTHRHGHLHFPASLCCQQMLEQGRGKYWNSIILDAAKPESWWWL